MNGWVFLKALKEARFRWPRWLCALVARYSQGITKVFFVENKERIQSWCGQHFLTMEQPLLLFWKVINISKINRKGWKTVTSIWIVARGMGMDVAVRPLMNSPAFSRKDQQRSTSYVQTHLLCFHITYDYKLYFLNKRISNYFSPFNMHFYTFSYSNRVFKSFHLQALKRLGKAIQKVREKLLLLY